MATMMKEKPRAKKKHKDKHATTTEIPETVPLPTNNLYTKEENVPSVEPSVEQQKVEDINLPSTSTHEQTVSSVNETAQNEILLETQESSIPVVEQCRIDTQSVSIDNQSSPQKSLDQTQAYKDVCHSLDIVSFKDVAVSNLPIEELENKLKESAYISQGADLIQTVEQTSENCTATGTVENMVPSAPMFEEESSIQEAPQESQSMNEVRIEKLQCMPLEVALHICGGKEMAEVREMSEREEALAEGGYSLRPEHPLVDLLSTYRCSAIAMEQESTRLSKGYVDAEKSRADLWRVEKRTASATEKCRKCDCSVTYTGQYVHATLLKEKLPAAQLRLQGLLKDVDESYGTYQHQALLSYYQIEEFISEAVQGPISNIRESLTLVLQELRASSSITCLNMEYFTDSLKRWARALCHALLSKGDARQLLFLLHQLFRQTHSVRWAAPLIRVAMCDINDAARALAILDLMLSAPVLETAKECTEAENEEMWEEVDRHGGAGAVSEGALREQDLLALLRAFPLRAMVARLVLLERTDITQTRPHEWQHSARSVLRACCCVRALLATAARAAHAHAHRVYARLRRELRALADHAVRAVAQLGEHNRDSYSKEAATQIQAELEAIFCDFWALLEPTATKGATEAPPATLLRPNVRTAYCVALMTHLHEKPPIVMDCLSLSLSLSCGHIVHVVSQAADCQDSAETTAMVVDFLVQVVLKSNKHCNGSCREAARECLPRLLSQHDYLITRAVHSIAYVHQLEPLQPSAAILKPFCLTKWRASPGEMRAVLDDWSRRSPLLLPCLLRELSYTPHDGLSLETQLTVGSWVCGLSAPAPDWAWGVLVRLRVHRSSWRIPLDAPPPEPPQGVFAEAYAVLSSSWGHSLPLICEFGAPVLCRVAATRPAVAAHALPLVMAAMMHSPASVSLTPQFASLMSTLLAPPQSLVQWARGEKAATPELLLRRMLAHVENQPSRSEREAAVSSWLAAVLSAGLAGAPLAAADALLLTTHGFTLQEAPKPEAITNLVRNAQHAPLACASALLAAHTQNELPILFPRLLQLLATQRGCGQKIHVDNALKQIGCGISSDELVIHQTAAALLAPAGQPSLPLWRLFMYLYLHSSNISSDPAPIGPLFFSGLVKSRTLAQLKKRLHETILHHHGQAQSFKTLLSKPDPKPKEKSKSNSPETILPKTSLGELTGESSASETDSGNEMEDVSECEEMRRVNANMLAYHEGAEKMLREYSCWLEAGDRVRATPHHAELQRFIPAAALSTAWAELLTSIRPARSDDDDLRAPRPPSVTEPPLTPLQHAVQEILMIKDRSEKRSPVPKITSPVGDVDFEHPRQLYMLVDKHLADVESFARSWAADVNRAATLDAKLWPLFCSLRHRKPLPAIRKQCPNKCGHVVLELEGLYEWPISEDATRGIAENRSSAKSALYKLLSARPKDAQTVAALNTIARRINSRETAVNVAQRAWACAGAVADCRAAHAALTAVLELLADRWICSNIQTLTGLVPMWCASASSGAQLALCRALMPRAADAARAPGGAGAWLYVALMQSQCSHPNADPQRAFSYLSKFDVTKIVDESTRQNVLEELLIAAQRWGREPKPELHVLLELIGVHIVSLTTAGMLPTVALIAARAAAAGSLPPASLAHVARAAPVAKHIPFDKLGHLLRELGVVWWKTRTELQTSGATHHHVTYAEHVAALQTALHAAFVEQAVALSYTPERVAVYAWSALLESWSAWVSPHPALPPLLSGDAYTTMLDRLVDNVTSMLERPGCEECLLSQVWEWAVQIYLNVTSAPSAARDSRVQLSGLLARLGALPWGEHQWPHANCLPAALQIITTTDLEMQTWLADTLRGIEPATWLRGVPDCDIAPRLSALLQLFAGPLRLRTETLEQAVHLPWHRLPEMALDQALQRFFVDHHNPQHPYHDTPQFRVILAASGLEPACASTATRRRLCAVSQWTRAASAPALAAHVAAQAQELLNILAALEPHIEESSDELEELLGRAIVIMCMEPAAAAALPTWLQWISGATPRMLRACLSAARSLTTLDYFAAIADAATASFMNAGGTWQEVSARIQGCAWPEPAPLLQRARLHAAYALSLTHPAQPADLASVVNFTNKELIISVWICALYRAATDSTEETTQASARAQLVRWAEPPRMALLRVLSNADEPTNKHRLLCRFALCALSPPPAAPLADLARALDACACACACATAGAGAPADVLSWATAPTRRHLPALACTLFPGKDHYFAEEVRLSRTD